MQAKIKGKRVIVKVKTAGSTYIGEFFVPELRTRLSDVLNDKDKDFISLTNVTINESERKIAYVCLNKLMIEALEPYQP